MYCVCYYDFVFNSISYGVIYNINITVLYPSFVL